MKYNKFILSAMYVTVSQSSDTKKHSHPESSFARSIVSLETARMIAPRWRKNFEPEDDPNMDFLGTSELCPRL